MKRAGTANHAAKLTDDQVRLIRYLSALGATQDDLAFMLSVGISTISRVTLRKSWRHVPDLLPVPGR